MTNEYTEVKVAVPVDRVAEFYKMFGNWLEGGDPATSDKTWRTGAVWGPDDIADATAFYASISPTARRILSAWASRSGQWLDAVRTAEEVGVNGPKGVAGSLSSVGKAANRMSRALPFEHEAGEGDTPGRYRMAPLVAELFRNAAKEAGR